MDRNKIISFLLAFVMILGIFVDPVFAITSNQNEAKEVNYETQEINGKSYKVYKVSELGLKNPEKLLVPKYRNRAAGDPMEDWVKLRLQSNTVGLTLGNDFHVEVYVALRKDDTKIAKAIINPTKEDVENEYFYFVQTAEYNENNPDHQDPDKWYLYVERDFKYDIRLKYGESGNFGTESMTMTISQRAVPLYKAVWFTNKQQRPVVDAIYNDGDNIANPVKLNTTDFAENEYKSFSSEKMPFYVGQKEVIVKEENLGTIDKEKFLVSDMKGAVLWKLLIDQNGEKKTKGTIVDGDTKYHFNITGDYKTPFVATMREELKVKFDPNGATFDPAVKAEQPIGHSMKIGEAFGDLEAVTVPTKDQITNIPKKDNKDQEFVGWVTDEANKDLDFSNGQNEDKLVDPNGYEVKENVTFYAVYAPVAQGRVAIQYVDNSGNAINDKYKIDSEKYPDHAEGNKGKPVEASKIPEPAFIGYKRTADAIDVTGKTYKTEQIETVEVKYEKLPDIIPEKKNGQDNPDVTPDVKEHYAKVTFQVATADDAKAKLQLDGADATSPLVYYVNPLEGKTIAEVASVKAVSKDDNLYKVDANDMWTYDPDSITGTDQVISQLRDEQDNVVKTEITLTAKVADTTASKFKDKLDPQDIKVWEKDPIDWKKGVKLKEANEDLQKILDKTETKVTDESNRNSDAANLPNGQKGDLKVTFEDGSSLEVKDQTLYVAPHKNDNNTNLPEDAVQVDFKIGDGVTGTAKTEYVKPGTDVKEDAPTVTLKEGFKDAKWYKDNATTEASDNDYKVTANAEFTAKATGKDKVVKLDDPENPTNFPKDPTDNSKNDTDYVTVKFVADANGKIKEGDAEKAKGIAYAVLKNTDWADAVTAGVVVPTVDAKGDAPKLVGKDKFYSFKEWQKEGTKVTEFAKVGEVDVTYTAVFGKADEFSVTYNLNAPEDLTVGGTAPTDDTKYLKDEEVTVKALAADNKLAGYEFTGWNTKANGEGTAYAADSKFAIKADTELFAQWNKTAPDVIPVDNENDTKGKDGEEIPTNYVFVEFKVKDADADKANIKDGQQAKFKVDPKATVTLTAPELEVKDAYKDSYTAKFNTADYTNKKFEQATIIWASVNEKGKIEVKYVFETNPKTKTLPDALKALKPEDQVGDNAVYVEPNAPTAPDTSSDEAKAALIEKDADGKKLGEWKAGNWVKTTDEDGNITYTLTWTFEEVGKSEKPIVNPVKPGDKEIKGKGKPGSEIEVKIPGQDEPIKTKVDENGDWTVEVPKDKELKDGDKVIVTQTEKDKKPSDPVEKTVTAEKKPEPKPEPKPVPEPEFNIDFKVHEYVPTFPVYAVVENKIPEIFTHEQYIFGYPDDTIRPDGDMTRAEAIAVVARLQKLDLSDKTSNIYKDTKAGMWYNAAINAAFREGYLLEKEGEDIRPNDKITRAELALLISHIDKKNNSVAPFEDVKGHKFEAAINQAYGNERIKGYPDGTFKPDNSITRAEVATMLNKLYDRNPDKNYIDANQNLVHNFKDMSFKGHWGYYELVEAYHNHKFARLANMMEEWKAIIK